MTTLERRTVSSLAALYAMRMLGLFMVLPIFSLRAQDVQDATPLLIGMAIGAYGLTQALFQIPFGMLSDRFGRKRMISAGLIIFLIGSVVAALSDSIYGIIAGRLLQGAGAIASVLMALLSDLTREEIRARAMATIGLSIGLSFAVALVLGPVVDQWAGLDGIFWLTAVMALAGLILLIKVVPDPVLLNPNRDAVAALSQLGDALRHRELLRLNLGIHVLHLVLTAIFVAVPLSLAQRAGVDPADHWWVYLSVMLLSFVAMVPLIIVAEAKRKMKPVFVWAIAQLAIGTSMILWLEDSWPAIWFALFVFFMAFNLLEATLPSLVSKWAPAGMRGTAMGVYSTSQFLGAFVGGAAGGLLMEAGGVDYVYGFSVFMIVLWILFAFRMQHPQFLASFVLKLDGYGAAGQREEMTRHLSDLDGVEEVVVVAEESTAYLKIDKQKIDEQTLIRWKDEWQGSGLQENKPGE